MANLRETYVDGGDGVAVVLGVLEESKDIIASLDLLPTKPVWANFSGLADGISGISISCQPKASL